MAVLLGMLVWLTACQSEQVPAPADVPAPALTLQPAEPPAPEASEAPEIAPVPEVKPPPVPLPAPPQPPERPPEPSAMPLEPPAAPSQPALLPVAPPEAGVIRLYYYAHVMTPGADPAALPGPHVIHSATSRDGINFREDPGERFSHDTGSQFGITDPDVVRMEDGSWLMFLSLGQSLLKAVSVESAGAFAVDNSFNWNQGGVAGSHNFGGTVRTFTSYGDSIHTAVYDEATGDLEYQGVAVGPPSQGTVGSPSLFEIDGLYHMVYAYHPFAGADPRQHEIYLATSADGVTWTQHEENRLVSQGSVPGAVCFNGIIYIYYCGVPPRPGEAGDMGAAVSTDNGQTFQHYRMIIEEKALSGAVDPAPVVADE